jgi:hypothetical protein
VKKKTPTMACNFFGTPARMEIRNSIVRVVEEEKKLTMACCFYWNTCKGGKEI